MSLKQTTLFDLNLFSGSSELLRQEMQIYYSNDLVSRGIFFADGGSSILESHETNTDLIEIDSESYLPALSYPVRISTNEEHMISDQEWRAYLIGGMFGDKEYPGVYNTNVYADHAINQPYLPFKPTEVERNLAGLSPSIVLTTEYYQDYSRFQSYTNTVGSELLLPNYYFLGNSLFRVSSNGNNYPEHQYPGIENYLNNFFVNQDLDEEELEKKKNVFVLEKTLDSTTMPFSSRTSPDIGRKNTELRKTNSNYIKTEEDLSKIYSLMPFANKLQISKDLANFNTRIKTFDGSRGTTIIENEFKTIIEDNNYEYKFLKLLKECFQNEISLTPTSTNFGLATDSYSIDYEENTSTEVSSISNASLRIIDLPTMLLYAYQNPIPETSDISVVDSESYQLNLNIFDDSLGTYRHIAADKSLDILNSFKDKLHESFDTNRINSTRNLFLQAGDSKYHETMAFRIQKIGGGPSGDSRTENTIQNIWFYNRNAAIKYVDTQVKYDTEYTYKIFSYVLLLGYKYQTTDLVATRKIAEEGDQNCLEFYDPYTGQRSPQLANDEDLRSQFDRQAGIDSQIAELEGQLINLESQYLQFLSNLRRIATSKMIAFFESFFDGEPVSHPIGTQTGPITDYKEFLENLNSRPLSFVFAASTFSLTRTEIFSVIEILKNYLENYLIPGIGENDPLRIQIQDLLDQRAEIGDFVNQLASNAQINTNERYLADLNIKIEPSLKIVEIPLEEKTMRIVDHPPNDFNVSPHHLQDQSNRLAFYLKYDTFSADTEKYPPTINPIDDRNETSYKEGKDFVPGSLTKEESVSPARFIEVYRMTEKPSSYRSFENNLRKTIDLKNEVGDIMSDHLFMERVRENTKYYYAFRAVNENGVAGQPSPIFESELINDGGYVYGLFNQLSESELVEPPPRTPFVAIKKLLNIVPNIQHLQLGTSDVDFNDNSVDQIGKIELGTAEDFWDEKFKIRLTSKKTGRKIDLNLTFERKEK